MQFKFKNFFTEATVAFHKSDEIKKGFAKSTSNPKPGRERKHFDEGTFGFEIECIPTDENYNDYKGQVDYDKLVEMMKKEPHVTTGTAYWIKSTEPNDNFVKDYQDSINQFRKDHGISDFKNLPPDAKQKFRDIVKKYEDDYIKYKPLFIDFLNGLDRSVKSREIIINIADAMDIDIPYVDGSSSVGISPYAWRNIDRLINTISRGMSQPVKKSTNFDKSIWTVEVDGNLVEVRSPILREGDLGEVSKLLNLIKNEKFGPDASAHVHVGMPENTTAFDLLAMTTLVDESSVVKDAGIGRNFKANQSFSQLREVWHRLLSKYSGIWDNNMLLAELEKISVDRFMGTNIHSFFKYHTVEFRYLSSEIVGNPGKFTQWIKYFLLLPRIAKSRNMIKFNQTGDLPEIIITRLPHDKIEIKNPKPNVIMPRPQRNLLDKRQMRYSEMAVKLIGKYPINLSGDDIKNNALKDIFIYAKIAAQFRRIDLSKFKTFNDLWNYYDDEAKRSIINSAIDG